MKELTKQKLYIEYVSNDKTVEEISKEYKIPERDIFALIKFHGYIRLKRKKWGIVRKGRTYCYDTHPEWFNKPGDIPA